MNTKTTFGEPFDEENRVYTDRPRGLTVEEAKRLAVMVNRSRWWRLVDWWRLRLWK